MCICVYILSNCYFFDILTLLLLGAQVVQGVVFRSKPFGNGVMHETRAVSSPLFLCRLCLGLLYGSRHAFDPSLFVQQYLLLRFIQTFASGTGYGLDSLICGLCRDELGNDDGRIVASAAARTDELHEQVCSGSVGDFKGESFVQAVAAMP